MQGRQGLAKLEIAPSQPSFEATPTPTPTTFGQERRLIPWLLNAVASPTRSGLSLGVIIGSDVLGLLAAGALAVGSRWLIAGDIIPARFLDLWPVVGLVVVVNTLFGLYHRGLVNPAQEIRRHTIATCTLFLVMAGAMFLFRNGLPYSRQVVLTAWALSLASVPIARTVARRIFSRCSWWGHAVVVLGAGKTGRMVVDRLQKQPSLGLKPVALLDDDVHKRGSYRGLPVVHGLRLASAVGEQLQARCAIVAMPGLSREKLISLLEQHAHTFESVIVIPDLFDFSTLWVSARDLGGMLALEVRPALLSSTAQLTKRLLDITTVVIGGLLVLPLMALVALAVRLDSRGPALYGHKRIGRGGRSFRAWKFRSMVQDGDAVLRAHLDAHPEARAEWEATRKLHNDPRVTRVGRFLRKTSLDELPQLWNVLIGEMSLIGPRPIVTAEKHHYVERFALYERVRPGLSGLWQVSGRSDTSYEERVRLDSYYVRNWSVWLDLYILARTIPVVLFGRGAC